LERWILEQWFPPEACLDPELPLSGLGSYEPIYVFESATGVALDLNLLVVQIIVKCALEPRRSSLRKRTDDANAAEQKEERIHKQDLAILEDEGPLVSQFHDGSAILAPGVK
jgi:hypothetical protein